MPVDNTHIHKWEIDIPIPVELRNKSGTLYANGETFRNGKEIIATIFFEYKSLRIILWTDKKKLDYYDVSYIPEEIWEILKGDKAFFKMTHSSLTYEDVVRRTEIYDGDDISYQEFESVVTGLPKETMPEAIMSDRLAIQNAIQKFRKS